MPFSPVLYTEEMKTKSENDAALNSGIAMKIFSRPRPHDCYQRLSNAEKKYIRNYAGLTKLEIQVFNLRCEGMSFDEMSRELQCHPSYCKKIAARIRRQIEKLIQS